MNSFLRLLKNYRLDELLLGIGDLTRKMFDGQKAVITVPVTRYQQVHAPIGTRILQQYGNVTISAWSLLEISYYSILHTNDFAVNTPTFDNIIQLCNEYIEFENTLSSKVYQDATSQKRLLFDLFGLSQKEFWLQELHTIKEQFNRDVEMLEVIPHQIEQTLNLDAILTEISGFDVRSLRKILFSIFAMGMVNSNLSSLTVDQSIKNVDKVLTKENILSVIESYTAEYQECRGSPFKHGFFYSKPIVRTTKGKYIVVNQFLVAKKIADGVFWKLRDYFAAKSESESREFTKQFGNLFEKYVHNLLSYYLKGDQFKRIPEGPGERADWIITTSRYQLIVEQKSGLMSLMLKDIHVDLKKYNDYLLKMKKGVVQLDRTAVAYESQEKTTLKFLLFYDQLYMYENILKEELISISGKNLTDNKNFFLIHIGDFEHLVQILSEAESIFNRIMEEKIQLEKEPSPEGKDFNQVIRKHYDKENLYIHNHLNHYDNYIGQIASVNNQEANSSA